MRLLVVVCVAVLVMGQAPPAAASKVMGWHSWLLDRTTLPGGPEPVPRIGWRSPPLPAAPTPAASPAATAAKAPALQSWLITRRTLPGGPEQPPRMAWRDAQVRTAQVLVPPEATLPEASWTTEADTSIYESATMPISMQYALYGALNSNPDLQALRQFAPATAEAVEVARRFPMALNPIVWIDIRPWVYARDPGRGMNQKDASMYFSLRQPVELGHQTRYREGIARAAHEVQRWAIVQAELQSLVQTYRMYQTAAYRREKLKVARKLAGFNERLVRALRSGLDAGSVQPADVALAEVEWQAIRQQVETARQDYVIALADLHNQMGTPDVVTSEPQGDFIVPGAIPTLDENTLVDLALRSRPEILAARARVEGTQAGIGLARGDMIPTPVVGPEYQRNENGTQFYGFIYITPLPILNNGQPLVRQREAEYRQAYTAVQQLEQRTAAQVRNMVAKWNAATRLVAQTEEFTGSLKVQVDRLERLFQENQTDLLKLLQARQRLIQVENARLDAYWQATQAQADLLAALGALNLITALLEQTERNAQAR